MKKKLFIMAAILTLAVSACQQIDMDTPVKSQAITQDEFAAGLKLVNLSDRIASLKDSAVTRSGKPDLEEKLDPIDIPVDEISIVICSWSWHRNKYGCKRGFGICDFKWFPNMHEYHSNQELFENSSLIEFDETGEPFMNIYLAEPIDLTVADSISTMVIDDDIVSEQADASGRYFIMKKGTYRYDQNIGQNGGYHINMERL